MRQKTTVNLEETSKFFRNAHSGIHTVKNMKCGWESLDKTFFQSGFYKRLTEKDRVKFATVLRLLVDPFGYPKAHYGEDTYHTQLVRLSVAAFFDGVEDLDNPSLALMFREVCQFVGKGDVNEGLETLIQDIGQDPLAKDFFSEGVSKFSKKENNRIQNVVIPNMRKVSKYRMFRERFPLRHSEAYNFFRISTGFIFISCLVAPFFGFYQNGLSEPLNLLYVAISALALKFKHIPIVADIYYKKAIVRDARESYLSRSFWVPGIRQTVPGWCAYNHTLFSAFAYTLAEKTLPFAKIPNTTLSILFHLLIAQYSQTYGPNKVVNLKQVFKSLSIGIGINTLSFVLSAKYDFSRLVATWTSAFLFTGVAFLTNGLFPSKELRPVESPDEIGERNGMLNLMN